VAAAKDLPQLSLGDALELTFLIARKDPDGIPAQLRAGCGSTWTSILTDATIEEAALVASCLAALPGGSFQEAVLALRAPAEMATRRRGERGVA
jgi:hypothetical protein